MSLLEQIASKENIRRAFCHVRKRARDENQGAGVDGVTAAKFVQRYDHYAAQIQRELLAMSYWSDPVRQVPLDKVTGLPVRISIHEAMKRDGCRILGIPTVYDRVVGTAIRQVIEPMFKPTFEDCSHGFRPDRGPLTALKRIVIILKEGDLCVFETDIAACFPNIPHQPVLDMSIDIVNDPRVIELIHRIMRSPLDTTPEEPNLSGLHQGGPLSPLMCNIYLTGYDREMTAARFKLIRYADDIIVFCMTEQEAILAREFSAQSLANVGLEQKESKTHLRHAADSFVFLGYDIMLKDDWIRVRASEKAVGKLDLKVTKKMVEYTHGELKEVCDDLREIFAGWLGHFGAVNVSYQIEDLDVLVRKKVMRGLCKRDRNTVKCGHVKLPSLLDMWHTRHQQFQQRHGTMISEQKFRR